MKMTGKELIIYILKNDLENVEVFSDGFFTGMMNAEEAAMKFEVGTATIHAWYQLGVLPGIRIEDNLYFLKDVKDPRIKIQGADCEWVVV